MENTAKSQDRLDVLNRIKENERIGGDAFNQDVENDPPSHVLMPDEVDYLNHKLKNKVCRLIAYRMGQKMRKDHNKINQISVVGIENAKGITGGAIITSNHFGFFESACPSKVVKMLNKKKKMYIVIKEGNYSMPGPYGFLFRHCDTLPLSSNLDTMKNFHRAFSKVLEKKHFILIYPEQSMWWNYRKPRPQKNGAAHLAVKNNVPIIPCFVTMEDLDQIDSDGFPIQKYTIHVMKPLYPDPNKSLKENVKEMTDKNYQMCVDKYEEIYHTKLQYIEDENEESL